MNKENAKDVLIRALKTLWQGALAYLVLRLPEIEATFSSIFTNWDSFVEMAKTTGMSILYGMLAAGFCAVYNGLIKPYLINKSAESEIEEEFADEDEGE